MGALHGPEEAGLSWSTCCLSRKEAGGSWSWEGDQVPSQPLLLAGPEYPRGAWCLNRGTPLLVPSPPPAVLRPPQSRYSGAQGFSECKTKTFLKGKNQKKKIIQGKPCNPVCLSGCALWRGCLFSENPTVALGPSLLGDQIRPACPAPGHSPSSNPHAVTLFLWSAGRDRCAAGGQRPGRVGDTQLPSWQKAGPRHGTQTVAALDGAGQRSWRRGRKSHSQNE